MKVMIVFVLVLTGVTVAFAQEGDLIPNLGASTEAAQSQEAPPAPPPNPNPCHFGPITKRISRDDFGAIIAASPTRRAAWYAILAREDDEEAEPFGFILHAPDDGLGDGLVCPEESP